MCQGTSYQKLLSSIQPSPGISSSHLVVPTGLTPLQLKEEDPLLKEPYTYFWSSLPGA